MKTNTQSKTAAHGQNVREITELWPDDLKRALAFVVSLVANHASASESAAWCELWAHLDRVTAQRDELLAALRDIARAAHYPMDVAEVSDRITEGDTIGAVDKLAGRIWSVTQAAIANTEKKMRQNEQGDLVADHGGNFTLDREEANEDYYSLLDDGRSYSEGESYAERNA